jgi:mono/diheme cytochrome c family protein
LFKSLTKAILVAVVILGNTVLNSFARTGNDSTTASGAHLFQGLACCGCHAIQGQGSTEGPDLDGVGSRLSRQELEVQLKTPRRRRCDSQMPSFAFVRPQESHNLLDFLQASK